jgi:hypothetical protein
MDINTNLNFKIDMKKLAFSIITIAAFAACNKVPTSNAIVAPWAGKGSISATVNNAAYLPDTATYSEINVPGFIYGAILAKSVTDTNWVDSIKTIKNFTINTPTGGGGINANYGADSSNKNFIITYQETTSDIGSSLPTGPTVTKTYSSLSSNKKLYIQNYENDATHIKGYFYGYLRSTTTNSYDTLRSFENGYFNIKK